MRYSRLRLKDEYCRWLFSVRRSSDVKTVEFRRPERSARAGRRGNFSDFYVLVSAMLLINEHRADVEASPAGNVNALVRRIEIHRVHALDCREFCDLLAGCGV